MSIHQLLSRPRLSPVRRPTTKNHHPTHPSLALCSSPPRTVTLYDPLLAICSFWGNLERFGLLCGCIAKLNCCSLQDDFSSPLFLGSIQIITTPYSIHMPDMN
ncbi:hypothetical protein C8F01DRAFT_1083300 [Mycena amicta]|nr:hypothetical protein C8F01DRAFT_1083300 [Mycena amicta]